MGAKHTPGPWKEHPASCWLIGSDGNPVARIGGCRGADARLIAAAPDLLALLIELTDIEGPLPGNAAWARKVKDAIARATGQSGDHP